MISLWLTVIALTLNNSLYDYPNEMPLSLSFIPTFAFCRLYYRIAHACGFDFCLSDISLIDGEIWRCVLFLYISSTVFLILGVYLHEVVPQEFGVPRHPLFIFSWLKKLCSSQNNNNQREAIRPVPKEEPEENEDDDCIKEREFVQDINQKYIPSFPLIVRGLRKEFEGIPGEGKKIAVRGIHLSIKKGEMFGLLGPNGAGKTTLISMLTGMYQPTSGEAFIGGFSLENELDKIQVSIGVCPQFDILWPELTVEEHLYFYARLKGVQPDKEDEVVSKAISEVFLDKFRDFKTQELSGGMRRRLSVAISLVGNPKIIFLDEPSTGLDPENRRQLWDILSQSKGKRALVITTHSMEEADVLCSRIGIISHGKLRCIGNQTHLKNKFTGGYQLFVNCYQLKTLRLMSARSKEFRENGRKDIQERDKMDLPIEVIENFKSTKMSEIHKNAVEFIKMLIPNVKLLRVFKGNFVFEVLNHYLNICRSHYIELMLVIYSVR